VPNWQSSKEEYTKFPKTQDSPPKLWASKGCREAIPIQRTHGSRVTFLLRSWVAIYALYVWTDTYFYIDIFMLRILGASRMKYSRPGDQATRICTLLSSMYFQIHWEYGILPLLCSGANLGSFFKVGSWIM